MHRKCRTPTGECLCPLHDLYHFVAMFYVRRHHIALQDSAVELVVLDDAETKTMFKDWIEANPRLWNEDIGEED